MVDDQGIPTADVLESDTTDLSSSSQSHARTHSNSSSSSGVPLSSTSDNSPVPSPSPSPSHTRTRTRRSSSTSSHSSSHNGRSSTSSSATAGAGAVAGSDDAVTPATAPILSNASPTPTPMSDPNGHESSVEESSSDSELKSVVVKVKDADGDEDGKFVIPDGGYGWVVVAASFSVHLVLLGVFYTFGILYVELLEVFNSSAGETALVGSVQQGLFSAVAVFVGQVIARYGCRPVGTVGALILTTSLVISSFATEIWHLIIAYGVLGGIGFQLVYSPAIVILGQWFKEKRGTASGIAVAGAGIGTLSFAPFVEYLIETVGWAWYLRIAALMVLVVMLICAQIFKSPPNFHKAPKAVSKGIIDFTLLKNPILLLLAATQIISGFGYFTPITHMVRYAEEAVGINSSQSALLITYFGIGSTVGRVSLGYLADRFSPLLMLCISLFGAGVVQAIAPVYSSYGDFIFLATSYGFLSGSFIALSPVIIVKYIGLAKFPQAFGLLNTFGTAGLFLGAPSAGWMRDAYGDYNIAFIVGGCLMMISIIPDAFIPYAIKKFNYPVGGVEAKQAQLDSDESISDSDGDLQKSKEGLVAPSPDVELSYSLSAGSSIFYNMSEVRQVTASGE